MKQRLLSVCAALALTAGAFAQSWTAPIDPASTGADVENGGTYYIKNVGCGQYIVGANSWATQISVSTDGKPYFNVVAEEASVEETHPETGETVTTTGFKLKMNGTFYFSGDHNRKDYEVSNKYLFRDSEASGFVDLGSQARNAIWVLKKQANGNYRIQSTWENGTFPNAHLQYAYAKNPGQGVQFNITEEECDDVNYMEWQFIPTTVSVDEMDLYNAKKSLYDQLLAAYAAGVDYAEASAIYENSESTPAELRAAADKLAGAIRAKKLVDLIATYNGEPVDITEFALVNPSFDAGNTLGWEVTEGMGQNLGFQAGAAQTDADGTTWQGYENGDIRISNFIEAWRSGAPLSDGVIAQVVYGLPEGRYRLEAQGIATDQVNSENVVGVYLFYDNGMFVYHSEESLNTGNGLPEELSFEFDFDGSESAKIGMMTESTNANWMCADNFKLYYIGETQTPPIYSALLNLIRQTEETMINIEYAQATVKEETEAALENASNLAQEEPSKDKADSYQAAYDRLSSAFKTLNTSAEAYKKLADLVETLNIDDEKYGENPNYAEYIAIIEPLMTQYEEALEGGTFTNEQIQEAIDGYKPLLKQAVQTTFDKAVAEGTVLAEPLDITPLFDGMSYVYSSSAVKYPNLPDSLWQNATKTANFKTQYGTAEVWNDTNFDIYRELELPKGKYTITVKAFYREAANVNNYTNFVNDATGGFSYLYAGNNQQLLFNVANLVTDVETSGWGTFNYEGPEGAVAMYQPNNQQSAHNTFVNEELGPKCINTIDAILSTDGKLRFGIKSGDGLQGDQWTVWEEFHIYYNAAEASDYNDAIQALIDQAAEANTHGVQATIAIVEAAMANGEKALDAPDVDTKTAAITQLNEALACVEKSAELTSKILTLEADYRQKQDENAEITSDYAAFDVLMETITVANEAEEYESNEQIENWINSLPTEWINYVLGWNELDEATATEPVELTMLVENPNFSASNATQGWVIETEATSGNRGTYENEFLEFWNVNAGWRIYQELPKLKEGYYQLTLDGLYRSAGTAAATDSLRLNNVKRNVMIFAGTQEQPLMAWTDSENGAIPGKLAELQESDYPELVGNNYGYVDETSGDSIFFVAPNNRAGMLSFSQFGKYANSMYFHYTGGAIKIGLYQDVVYSNDWTPFGHIALFYIGTEAPDAIEGINADADKRNTNAAIYNLAGQKVSKMQKGIYIVGGKKYLVK